MSNFNRFEDVMVLSLNEAEKDSLLRLAMKVVGQQYKRGKAFTHPKDVSEFLCLRFAKEKNEIFGAMFLDTRHRMLGIKNLFYGTIDGASVHPRVVVQHTLEYNARALVLFHNHPSGDPEPSADDRRITTRLREALHLIDVRLLDHVIVGGTDAVSMAERGLI